MAQRAEAHGAHAHTRVQERRVRALSAVRASVVWILTVAEVNHAFDFMEIVGEGYAGEEELTFPMGTKVSITKVVTHRDAAHAGMRPAGCSAARYTIDGTIH